MGIRELSPELAEKAKNELNEDPARIPQDLQHIKDWLAKQPHIKARTDDQWLIAFLRGCKYSLEKTKEKLDTFYTLKTTFPELMAKKDPMTPLAQEILKIGIAIPLPKLSDPLAPRIIIIRPGSYDPTKYNLLDVMKISQMVADINMDDDDSGIINGHMYILDLSNVTLGHLTQMSPAMMKKMVVVNQDALPFRQKGTHYIHTPSTFETVFNVFKSFMNEKMRSRLYVHNEDMDSFHKYIPKSILPEEYGGDAGPFQNIIDEWKTRVESRRDWFLEDWQHGTDESKRVGTPKTAESMFGLEGSFRQLNLD